MQRVEGRHVIASGACLLRVRGPYCDGNCSEASFSCEPCRMHHDVCDTQRQSSPKKSFDHPALSSSSTVVIVVAVGPPRRI